MQIQCETYKNACIYPFISLIFIITHNGHAIAGMCVCDWMWIRIGIECGSAHFLWYFNFHVQLFVRVKRYLIQPDGDVWAICFSAIAISITIANTRRKNAYIFDSNSNNENRIELRLKRQKKINNWFHSSRVFYTYK